MRSMKQMMNLSSKQLSCLKSILLLQWYKLKKKLNLINKIKLTRMKWLEVRISLIITFKAFLNSLLDKPKTFINSQIVIQIWIQIVYYRMNSRPNRMQQR